MPSNTLQSDTKGCVYLLDDDRDIRAQLGALLRLLGYDVRTFADGKSFFDAFSPDLPAVVLLDMTMPGMSGLEVQSRLVKDGNGVPVILFLSGNSERQQIVQAMKAGADDFLWKPVSRDELTDRVNKAMLRSKKQFERALQIKALRNGLEQLSPRELQIYELIINGHQNKQIATALNIRADTVKKHRAVICEKFLVKTTADLIALSRLLAKDPVSPLSAGLVHEMGALIG